MISAELAQRRFVQLKQNLAQLLGCRITSGETLSVNLTQGANEGVSVLVADFAIVVAVAIVETCLAHAALHGAHGRQHPPARTKWQSCAATGQRRDLAERSTDWNLKTAKSARHEIPSSLLAVADELVE